VGIKDAGFGSQTREEGVAGDPVRTTGAEMKEIMRSIGLRRERSGKIDNPFELLEESLLRSVIHKLARIIEVVPK